LVKQNQEKTTSTVKNGILYLKGGDLTEELKDFPKATEYNSTFEDEFLKLRKLCMYR
jgi:16S rRNA (guanine527-N7)-methyltransferase